MRKFMMGLALGAAIAGTAGVAVANQCPLLIKQLDDQLPKVTDKAKHDRAKKLRDECEKLHKDGKHADSVKKCEESAKVAGITLDVKK
jgi:hypothetical protein